MNSLEKTIIVLVISTILISSVYFGHVDAKSKVDKKAWKSIKKAIAGAVEGHFAKIDMVNISKTNDSSIITVYNKTVVNPIVNNTIPPVINNTNTNQTIPLFCPSGTHLQNATLCVRDDVNVPPVPVPTPTTTVCMTGDLSGSSVPSAMKDCNLKVGLGDLGYSSTLSYFKGLNFDKCVIGNHDAIEDGSSAIYNEALAYCGDHWSLKTANGTTLLIGMNTNGDVNQQVQAAKTAISQNPQVKTVILLSHKAGHVPLNSDHPAEAKLLYQQLEALIPTSVKLYEVVAHNHVLSSAPSMNWYQAGGGGRSHYACGTDAVWTFCNNGNYGYLKLTVDNQNGNITTGFYDTSNKRLN